MRTVDRNGIHLDQCDGCRGIFLDWGELEQIVRAEQSFYSAAPGRGYQSPQPATPPPPPPAYGRPAYPDSPRAYGGHGYPDSPRAYGGHHGHKGHKRRSFLEELFD